MKLDKIKFAKLLAYISYTSNYDFSSDVNYIDDLIDVDAEPNRIYPQISDINYLMELMASGNHKIEAIKAYRKLTGLGLKESKEQVEKYWVSTGGVDAAYQKAAGNNQCGMSANLGQEANYTKESTLSDILYTAIKR
jgi:ribosomal protein L7/L12